MEDNRLEDGWIEATLENHRLKIGILVLEEIKLAKMLSNEQYYRRRRELVTNLLAIGENMIELGKNTAELDLKKPKVVH